MPAYEANKASDLDRIFSNNLAKVVENSTKQLDKLQFKSALEAIMEFCRECNRYVDAKEPWKTRKEDMVSTCITLGQALNAIFTLGVLLQPFLPFTAKKILSAFDIDQELIAWSRALDFPSAGSKLIKPEILFAKIEDSQSAS